MDPLTALSVACNVIDLVSTAISCGLAVRDIYKSVDGRTRANAALEKEVDGMKAVVVLLREKNSKIKVFTDDDDIQKKVSLCTEAAEQLHRVLEDCRDKSKTVRGAIKALFLSSVNSDKIDDLQKHLVACKDDLRLSIAIATRIDVSKALKALGDIEMKNTQIVSGLTEMNERLDPANLTKLGANEESKTLQDALKMAIDGLILKALYSEDLGQRFQEVKIAEEGTFSWIFTSPETMREKEDQLSITLPDWLKTGSGIFHIAGKPGSGKSTLMKYLCQHDDVNPLLEDWKGNGCLIFAKFFFKRQGSRAQRSLHGLVQGLLYEILCEIPHITRTLFLSTWLRASRRIQAQQTIQLSTEEMIEALGLLVKLSADPQHANELKHLRICFFIDGLDEFDDSGVNETHGELAQLLLDWTNKSGGNVKMCVSSRIEAPFVGNFPVQQRITLNKLTADDIELFARTRLDKHNKFCLLRETHNEECEELLKQITTAANGVFLWVALLIHSLTQGLESGDPIKVLQKRVAKTPPDLNKFLDQIMAGIKPTYRDGAFMLLATVLRATVNLISDKQRPPEYTLYDDSILLDDNGEPRDEFYLSLIGSFSILWALDYGVEMTHEFELGSLKFLDKSSADYVDKEQWPTTLLVRCNGLVEASGDDSVKFMHRSIPEFLQQYFRRNSDMCHVNDEKVSIALSWAYLVETKYVVGFKQLLHDVDDEKESEKEKENKNDRLYIFLCRLRQTDLEQQHRELLFPILFSIENTMRQNPLVWPQKDRFLERWDSAAWQGWSLLYLSAFVGHYEFLDWVLRNPQTSDDTFNLMASVIATIGVYRTVLPFTVEAFKVLFDHGFKADMVFPSDCDPLIRGKPLWHSFLLAFVFSEREYRYSCQILNMWLRQGTNADVCYRGRGGMSPSGEYWIGSVEDGRDGSGNIDVNSTSSFYAIGALLQPPFTLRQAIASSSHPSRYETLDLIDAQIRERNPPTEPNANSSVERDIRSHATESAEMVQSAEESSLGNGDLPPKSAGTEFNNEVWSPEGNVTQKSLSWGMTGVWWNFVIAGVLALFLVQYLV
ncbi:hypothetical protein L207DRAFT_638482 [Hyaloscypha variabilis F]|uniref:Nephrocystin 3-like N-terminal domain-containing protein n=1 Tax=Hyaloscypha variabilis (strain UAMH 11265 / GT02V1 / F) TaxID=1149755 RepID=A0A2J6R931_HYAVF|nr:hypothetical protein L207DRAFT_638482 [Hyaloscypha variabilis F]